VGNAQPLLPGVCHGSDAVRIIGKSDRGMELNFAELADYSVVAGAAVGKAEGTLYGRPHERHRPPNAAFLDLTFASFRDRRLGQNPRAVIR
jgi:hypothetical protein